MKEICQQVRETSMEWVGFAAAPRSGESGYDRHLADCAACREWVRRAEERAQVLASLSRSAVPAELDVQVAEELRFDSNTRRQRIERTLGALKALAAPPELAERVQVDSLFVASPPGQAFDEDPSEAAVHGAQAGIQALQSLTSHPAPAVLDRLVAEELENPTQHRTSRFTDLEKMRAPDLLDKKVERGLRRTALRRRWVPILGALAAASLLAWLAVGRFSSPEVHSRPFEVVRPQTIQAFGPWIQSGLGAWAGDPVQVSKLHAKQAAERKENR